MTSDATPRKHLCKVRLNNRGLKFDGEILTFYLDPIPQVGELMAIVLPRYGRLPLIKGTVMLVYHSVCLHQLSGSRLHNFPRSSTRT